MKREIFLYGHFGDCFSLGRNLCPDDLVKNMQSKKQEPLAPVFLCHDNAGFQPRSSRKKPIGPEHALDAPHRLANTVAVFNQRKRTWVSP
jgi:hypothetical protein